MSPEREPQPFFTLPLPRSGPDRAPARDRLAFAELCGRFQLEIEVLSEYLHVGNGTLLLDAAKGAYWQFSRRQGEPVIPGTGIKGAVRAVVEAISNSCLAGTERGEHDIPRERRRCEVRGRAAAAPLRLCPACRIFGTTGYRGRAFFSDAVPVGGAKMTLVKIPDLWPPKRGSGRKFYRPGAFRPPANPHPERNHRFVEAVAKGARFTAWLHFESLNPAEMELLLRGLGLDLAQESGPAEPRLPIKLGGAKPRCLGTVRIRPTALFLVPTRSPETLRALARGGNPAAVDEHVRAWLTNRGLVDRKAWETLLKECTGPTGPCATRMY